MVKPGFRLELSLMLGVFGCHVTRALERGVVREHRMVVGLLD